MSAFFDPNILVYAQQTGGKADQARALFKGGGKLSVQVLNEFTATTRWVGTGFPSRQTRNVCAEIMLKQKDRAG